MLRTPDGVDFYDVVEVTEGQAYSSISRRNGRRVVNVSMNVEPKRAVGQVLDAIQADVLPTSPTNFPGLTWTFVGSNAEMRNATGTLYNGFAPGDAHHLRPARRRIP